VNDPAEVFRGVLDFLEVDSSFKADFSVVNPNTTVKSQAMRRVIQGMWFGPLREFAPPAVRGVGRRMFERLQAMNTQTQARVPLDEAVRQRLKSALSADVDELRTLINRPLEGWSC
jgi:hypothetical protein